MTSEQSVSVAFAAPASPPFRAVYHDYFEFVWRCARRLGVPTDAIEGVVHDIFIVVHGRLKTLERPESLRTWLYSVVRSTVSTYHHGRIARESSEPLLDNEAIRMQPSPLDLADLSDEPKLLWTLLGELDPPNREVLVLAGIEEMTMPEIAEAIGIPLNVAHSRLRAACQEFDEAVAALMIDGGSGHDVGGVAPFSPPAAKR